MPVVFSVARVLLAVFLSFVFTSYEVRRLVGGSAELKGAALTLTASRKEIAAAAVNFWRAPGLTQKREPARQQKRKMTRGAGQASGGSHRKCSD